MVLLFVFLAHLIKADAAAATAQKRALAPSTADSSRASAS